MLSEECLAWLVCSLVSGIVIGLLVKEPVFNRYADWRIRRAFNRRDRLDEVRHRPNGRECHK